MASLVKAVAHNYVSNDAILLLLANLRTCQFLGKTNEAHFQDNKVMGADSF